MDRASLSSGFNPIGFHITVLALRPDVEFGLAMWQICSAVNVQTGVDWVLCGFGLPTRFPCREPAKRPPLDTILPISRKLVRCFA